MSPISRLRYVSFTILLALVFSPAAAAETFEPTPVETDAQGVRWFDARVFGIEGQGWTETKSPFDRLPAKAEGVVRPAVWNLSRNSAGLCVRFKTNASTLSARWELTSGRLGLPHMAASGASGLDLYVKTDDGQWRWAATGMPKAKKNSVKLITGIPEKERDYLLYFPLYNSVTKVELGFPAGSTVAKAQPWSRKPIVFYGTSITHGACASRPGMVHTAILGRRLGYPVINLGFSGNGTMDPEIGELMAELDAAVYVIDCLPNMQSKQIEQRIEPLVKQLRAARPETPILLVEDRTYANAFLYPAKQKRHAASRRALREGYERLSAAGINGLHYLPGEHLLGADGDDTVDSSHPTDLGFFRQANAFEEVLRPLLSEKQ